ncbi:MAG TPA: hypothetical protein VEC56_00580 [Candidatus Krumholzibacteria bacterium]|nr:hypothetical protein [Candidatus Krumholzibacteria bacterium]
MSRSNHKKINAALVIATVCICLWPGPAPANDMGVHMGYYFDSEAISLGFGLLTSMSSSQPRWFFNPNAEMIVGDGRDMAAFNFDFHYDFATDSDLTFWAGAGPGLYLIERPFDDDLEVGLNVLAGFGAQTGSVRPFVQGKAVVMDDAEASLAVGLRF